MNTIFKNIIKNIYSKVLISYLLLFIMAALQAQQNESKVLTLDSAVILAINNHPKSKNASLKVEAAKVRNSTVITLDPTNITWEHGQIYSPVSDNRIVLSQNLGSPFTHVQQNKLQKNQIELSHTFQKITEKQLIASVKEAYFLWVHQISFNNLIVEEVKFYEEFMNFTKLNSDSVDNLLMKTLAETRYLESLRKKFISEEELRISVNKLNRLIYSEEIFRPSEQELDLYTVKFPEGQEDKFYPYTFKEYFQQQVNQKNIEVKLEKSHLYPEISAGYFHQSVNRAKNLQGFQLGMSVPLWFLPQTNKIKEARITSEIASNEATYKTYELEQTIDDLKIKLDQEFINVIYFRESALEQAEQLLQIATIKLQKEEINYSEFLLSVSEAMKLKADYLTTLLNYNITAVELEFYLN